MEGGINYVKVPNILLQDELKLRVYAYNRDYTKIEQDFKIIPRSKPADYVYTPTEIKSFEALEARVETLETEGVPQETFDKGIEEYLKTHELPTGVSSWNDLTDKPFYTDMADVILLENHNIVTSGSGAVQGSTAIGKVELTYGDTYYVVFDGNEYECVCGSFIWYNTSTAEYHTYQYLGNGSLFGTFISSGKISKTLPDTGEPFMIYGEDNSIGQETIIIRENVVEESPSDTHSVVIKQPADGSKIHTIDGRYIPSNIARKEDLVSYVTKTELNAAGYTTMAAVEAKGYLTEHQDLSQYALKTEIPSVEGLATETYVDNAIANIEIGTSDNEIYIGATEPTNSSTKLWINPDGSSANYATETYVDNAISAIVIPDVSNFTTMAEVEAKGYQTENQVNALINTALGVIENGAY